MADTLTPQLANLHEAITALQTIIPQIIGKQPLVLKEDIHAGLIIVSYGVSLLPDPAQAAHQEVLPGFNWIQLVQLILQLISDGLGSLPAKQ